MADLNLNLSGVSAQSDYSPLPPGLYTVMVSDTGVVMTKATNVPMLKMSFEVVEGPFKSRMILDNFVLSNEIAQKRMKALALAGHHPHPDFIKSSEEFHGMVLQVKLKVEEKPGFSASNKIISFAEYPNGANATAMTKAPDGFRPQPPMPNQPTMPPAQSFPQVPAAPAFPPQTQPPTQFQQPATQQQAPAQPVAPVQAPKTAPWG